LLKKWFATASATDSSNDETDEPDWVETDLVGVQKIFPMIEPDQWLVVMTNSIGQIDLQGQYKQLWDDDSEELSFSTAAVSHDGRWLACGDYSGTVHLWQVAMDGSLNDYEKFEAHQELVLSLNFVGEQNVLFSTATDCSMAQWKISNEGTEHETIPIDTSAMDSNEELIGVTETSEDRLIVATEKQLWATDLGSNTLKSIFPSQIDAMISIVRASPKSNWILLGTDSEITPVQLLNLKDQTVVFPELPMLASLAAGTFSENGQMIAASGYKGETILINLATDKPTWWDLPKLTGGYRKFMAFTSGGKYLITLDERGGEEIWPVDHLRLILQSQTEVYAVSPER
jgi:WD40 repeat protein